MVKKKKNSLSFLLWRRQTCRDTLSVHKVVTREKTTMPLLSVVRAQLSGPKDPPAVRNKKTSSLAAGEESGLIILIWKPTDDKMTAIQLHQSCLLKITSIKYTFSVSNSIHTTSRA